MSYCYNHFGCDHNGNSADIYFEAMHTDGLIYNVHVYKTWLYLEAFDKRTCERISIEEFPSTCSSNEGPIVSHYREHGPIKCYAERRSHQGLLAFVEHDGDQVLATGYYSCDDEDGRLEDKDACLEAILCKHVTMVGIPFFERVRKHLIVTTETQDRMTAYLNKLRGT